MVTSNNPGALRRDPAGQAKLAMLRYSSSSSSRMLVLICLFGCLSACSSFVAVAPSSLRQAHAQKPFLSVDFSSRLAQGGTKRRAASLHLRVRAGEGSSPAASKHSKAFDEMLDRLSKYPRPQVLSVKDPRTRTVLAGIIEGVEVPEVRDSFRVLYEDYPPIRFGGDFLFKQLEATIKGTETNAELSESALSSSSLLKAKQVFKLADTDGSGELDRQEVQEFLQAVKDRGMLMTWGQAEDFVKDLDTDRSGTVSFPEFVKAAEQLLGLKAKDGSADADAAASAVVAEISLSLGGTKTLSRESRSENKYSKRFDGMIESFHEMEKSVDIDAIENKRLATVFKGCIVGGRTQGVVDALKVVYVDYRIIRMCGDLIFGLVKALMQR